jgi:PKD domain
VQGCFEASGLECSANSEAPVYCSYHSNIPLGGGGELIYADQPYVSGTFGCVDFNFPNGTTSDGAIQGGLSHEHAESITDPEPNSAWTTFTDGGDEIADKCRTGVLATEYGTPLGKAPNGAYYNEVINGHLYWYQQVWSNQGHACLQRLTFSGAEPTATFTSKPGAGNEMTFNATGSTAPGGVAEYDWQFNDPPGSAPVETTTPTVSHAFPTKGPYVVALTVFAQEGTSIGTARTVEGGNVVSSPTVVTAAASSITQTSATLNATVNPNEQQVSECKLEYGTTTSYGSSASCSSLPGSGSRPVAVSASVTGLAANTTYHFRVSATNRGGTSSGSDETFKTLAGGAPTVVTAAASSITQTSATLNATVNPNEQQVSECKLEYGTTTSYGSSASCSSLPGSGSSPVAVSASVTGLSNKITYYFRISATNPAGTSDGGEQAFRAASPHWYRNGVMITDGQPVSTIAWGTLKLTNATLGEVECHEVIAGQVENPTDGGAAVDKVQASAPYECVSESCKALGGAGIEVTAEKLPWNAEVAETEEGAFRMRTGNRLKAAGAVFERVNCIDAQNAQFFGENVPRFLNNGLAIGSAPGEEEFDQPGSGELESESLGAGKIGGKVKIEGYLAQELLEIKSP